MVHLLPTFHEDAICYILKYRYDSYKQSSNPTTFVPNNSLAIIISMYYLSLITYLKQFKELSSQYDELNY